MANNGGVQMQQLMNQNQPAQQAMEDWEQELAALRPHNYIPQLPISPCIKVKATGEIWPWSEDFAARSDLCVNCDEKGSENPADWQGRKPKGWGDAVVPPNPMSYTYVNTEHDVRTVEQKIVEAPCALKLDNSYGRQFSEVAQQNPEPNIMQSIAPKATVSETVNDLQALFSVYNQPGG